VNYNGAMHLTGCQALVELTSIFFFFWSIDLCMFLSFFILHYYMCKFALDLSYLCLFKLDDINFGF
jgi:hypothetical protein